MVYGCSTLERFIDKDRERGLKSGTVKRDLAVIRTILNHPARRWRHSNGEPWLATAPLITMPEWHDKKVKYTLDYQEQARLFKELPDHLARAALFAISTGSRDGEQRALKWSWLREVPNVGSFFVIDSQHVKTQHVRVIALNATALSVLETCRGHHPEYVFTYKGQPFKYQFGKRSWRLARERAGLPNSFDWHAMRTTFASRMRAAGVLEWTRNRVLGHKLTSMADLYAQASLEELIEAVSAPERNQSSITILRAVS